MRRSRGRSKKKSFKKRSKKRSKKKSFKNRNKKNTHHRPQASDALDFWYSGAEQSIGTFLSPNSQSSIFQRFADDMRSSLSSLNMSPNPVIIHQKNKSKENKSEESKEFPDELSEGEKDACIICMDNKKCWVNIPCGHIPACGACAAIQTGKPCALCMQAVDTRMRVFS